MNGVSGNLQYESYLGVDFLNVNRGGVDKSEEIADRSEEVADISEVVTERSGDADTGDRAGRLNTALKKCVGLFRDLENLTNQLSTALALKSSPNDTAASEERVLRTTDQIIDRTEKIAFKAIERLSAADKKVYEEVEIIINGVIQDGERKAQYTEEQARVFAHVRGLMIEEDVGEFYLKDLQSIVKQCAAISLTTQSGASPTSIFTPGIIVNNRGNKVAAKLLAEQIQSFQSEVERSLNERKEIYHGFLLEPHTHKELFDFGTNWHRESVEFVSKSYLSNFLQDCAKRFDRLEQIKRMTKRLQPSNNALFSGFCQKIRSLGMTPSEFIVHAFKECITAGEDVDVSRLDEVVEESKKIESENALKELIAEHEEEVRKKASKKEREIKKKSSTPVGPARAAPAKEKLQEESLKRVDKVSIAASSKKSSAPFTAVKAQYASPSTERGCRLPSVNTPLVSLRFRVMRWIGVNRDEVKGFSDLTQRGDALRYAGMSDTEIDEQIVRHDPSGIVQLMGLAKFRENYLVRTSKGYLAHAEFIWGEEETEKTVVSISEDLQGGLFHYFIHKADEILPQKGGILEHLFRDTVPVTSSESERSQGIRDDKRTYEWVSSDQSGHQFLSVSYAVNRISCRLVFYPVAALRKRN